MPSEIVPPPIATEDLEICLKVLQQVADDPKIINTHDRFKSLVAKIHKTGKKSQRQAVQVQHRQDDRALKESAAIVQSQLKVPLLKGDLACIIHEA
jgi:alpha-D-ribose 1-methylphosphonate 5-phosphate C-P lyase